jgi:magnesium transporter
METIQNKTGAPPGTIVYQGKRTTENVKLTLIQYNESQYSEKDFYDLSECLECITPDTIKWINVDGIHKVEVIEALGKRFNIHPLTLEDIVNPQQRAKFEDYDSYVVAIMKMIYYDHEIHSEQLTVVLLEGMVISFQEVHGGDAFDMIRNRLRQGKGAFGRWGRITLPMPY